MKLVMAGMMAVIVMMGGWIIKNNNKVVEKIYTVSRVIDGDTFVVDNNQIIRLASVDSPEKDMCGFEESKKALEELIVGKKLKIVGDMNEAKGRLLASVWADNVFVNAEMARMGWTMYTGQMTDSREQIKTAGEEARLDKKGIYGKCLLETNIENPYCLIKGNNNKDQKIYFLPGCKTYTSTDINLNLGDRWFCTEKEAIVAGYVKAQNCK